ncbi:MAG: glycosyltransferase [Terriglobales bacterium]
MANICYLASANVTHTTKWAEYFVARGHQVHVISFEPGPCLSPNVYFHQLRPRLGNGLRYFLAAREIRRLIANIKPTLLHAHYATGYGTLGRLSGFRPYILSVWGSDVFDFPRTSALHRRLLKLNLNSADHVCSTSHVMARETHELCNRPITVTPFGVDCSVFRPGEGHVPGGEFVVGTVKTLEPKYGIEYLIRGFALLNKRYSGPRNLRLVIAGQGSLKNPLERLARELDIAAKTEFLGFVSHAQVPDVLNRLSVFAAPSVMDSESFGVAVVEASACELPVVVSDVGGLPEVVKAGVTGFVVPPRDPQAIAAAFLSLLENDELRNEMGRAGRRLVVENYEWLENAGRMERVYDSVVGSAHCYRSHQLV